VIFSLFLGIWFVFYGAGTKLERSRVLQGLWPDREDRMSSKALRFNLLTKGSINIFALIVGHPGFPSAVERVMARCSLHLNRNYDPQLLAANGYRIKEMGDGLIASIGFPFATPGSQNSCELALTIAEEFCAIFKEEMQQLAHSEDLYCSVGMAYGIIEGFYPQGGVRQYDLRGRTVMLATRYESMRNIIFEKLGHMGSVIFMQDYVYKQLPKDKQLEFTAWDTQKPQSRIRDDQDAKQAWVKFVAEAKATHVRDRAS